MALKVNGLAFDDTLYGYILALCTFYGLVVPNAI
jgi:hypothetical protein